MFVPNCHLWCYWEQWKKTISDLLFSSILWITLFHQRVKLILIFQVLRIPLVYSKGLWDSGTWQPGTNSEMLSIYCRTFVIEDVSYNIIRLLGPWLRTWSKLNIGKSEIRSHYVMNVCCFGRKRKPEDHDKEVENEIVNNC